MQKLKDDLKNKIDSVFLEYDSIKENTSDMEDKLIVLKTKASRGDVDACFELCIFTKLMEQEAKKCNKCKSENIRTFIDKRMFDKEYVTYYHCNECGHESRL